MSGSLSENGTFAELLLSFYDLCQKNDSKNQHTKAYTDSEKEGEPFLRKKYGMHNIS